MNPGNAPPARAFHAMAYDSQSDRVILFSGAYPAGNTTALLNDTWAYDFNTNTWANMNPGNAPPARFAHAMAYDSRSDRVILFSGASLAGNTTALLNDTWAYDFNTNIWANLATAPSAPSAQSMAYADDSDALILI